MWYNMHEHNVFLFLHIAEPLYMKFMYWNHIELCETVPKEHYAIDVRWLFITSVHNIYIYVTKIPRYYYFELN